MTAGDLLREARERSGLRGREIAARLGVSTPAISLAEHRGDRLTVRRLRDQLEACGYELHLMVRRVDA
jgi:transcriptional regulator with XRE-family HTH domain